MTNDSYYIRRHVEGLRGRVFAAAAACLLKRNLLAIETDYRGNGTATDAGQDVPANPRSRSVSRSFPLLKYAQGICAPKFDREGAPTSALVQWLIEKEQSLRHWGMHPIWAILHAQADRHAMRSAIAMLPPTSARLMLAEPGDARAELHGPVIDGQTLARLRRMEFDAALTAHAALVCTSILMGNTEARTAAYRSLKTLAGKAEEHPVWRNSIFDLMLYLDAQLVRSRRLMDVRG